MGTLSPRYVNVTILGGFLEEGVDEGETAGGGRAARAWLANPVDERPGYTVRRRVLAIGHVATQLLELAAIGAAVDVVGELTSRTEGKERVDYIFAKQIVEHG